MSVLGCSLFLNTSDAAQVQVNHTLGPITALAVIRIHRLFLLVGQAQCLKIFDYDSHDLVNTERVFQTQAVHGIACSPERKQFSTSCIILTWGSRLVRAFKVSVKGDGPRPELECLGLEIHANDWILDGCFAFGLNGNESRNAVLLTAHNELLELELQPNHQINGPAGPVLKTLSFGPGSILYSAHVLWTENEGILIAAGTVFGEVIFWSVSYDIISSKPLRPSVHHTFTGHEGSIFGVRISDEIQINESRVRRVLASCSDDRTIRLWNISRGSLAAPIEPESQCLATVMGHTSRIWGLRFLSSHDTVLRIMSLGEDGTAQSWWLALVAAQNQVDKPEDAISTALRHESTYSYHSGKNIWAAATFLATNGDQLIWTGGADGRIVSYSLDNKPSMGGKSVNRTEYVMAEVPKSVGISCHNQTAAAHGDISRNRQVFNEMKGRWRLSRYLKSAISNYPSGVLNGFATFEEIAPSDSSYNAEYLYSEQGDFKTEQGLTMKATRKYVYRYQENTDGMSAWFVKPDSGAEVDYLFHTVMFKHDEDTSREKITRAKVILRASGNHLCIADNYLSDYFFELESGRLSKWGVKYTVTGPQKDYVADAVYTREDDSLKKRKQTSLALASTRHDNVENPQKPVSSSSDALKSYVWVSESHILSTTEQGNVLFGSVNTKRKNRSLNPVAEREILDVTWTFVGQKDELRSSALSTCVVSKGIVVLTSRNGDILLFDYRSKSLDFVHSVRRKVAYMKAELLGRAWTGLEKNDDEELVGVLVKCLGSRQCQSLFLKQENSCWRLLPDKSRILELRQDFVITSSCFVEDEQALLLGSRDGNMGFCDLSPCSPTLVCPMYPDQLHHIHGQEAVTVIQVISSSGASKSSKTYHVLTCGRDGHFAIYQTPVLTNPDDGVQRRFSLVHSGTPPFGPNIEGAFLDAEKDDLFLWGFRSKYFVVWNETKKIETMTVECGGAHRQWAYSPLANGAGGGSFVWTKASVCNIHSQSQASHQVIQPGGHGREIKALAVSPPLSSFDGSVTQLIATGAEDTAIRLFDTDFQCLSIQTKHTTGIQQLHWSSNGRYLFSAAGCEEFFIWRVRREPCQGVAVGIYCEGSCQPVTEERDLRIMDFALNSEIEGDSEAYLITMVYSDSSVRLFRYSAESGATHQKSLLLVKAVYATCSLTVAISLPGDSHSQFCTAGSDGRLVPWSLETAKQDDATIRSHDVEASQGGHAGPVISMEPLESIPVHLSGVKCSAVAELSAGGSVVATGGDDQAIAFTGLSLPWSSSPCVSTVRVSNAHASAVTALAYLGTTKPAHQHRFASVGSDQRLRTWLVTIVPATDQRPISSADLQSSKERDRPNTMTVSKEHNVYTSVADVSSLDCYISDDGESTRRELVIAGVGMETISLSLEGLSEAEYKHAAVEL